MAAGEAEEEEAFGVLGVELGGEAPVDGVEDAAVAVEVPDPVGE